MLAVFFEKKNPSIGLFNMYMFMVEDTMIQPVLKIFIKI